MSWNYKYLSPSGGKVYHKGDSIMIIYSEKIKIYKNVPFKNFFPVFAEYCVERNSKGSKLRVLKAKDNLEELKKY